MTYFNFGCRHFGAAALAMAAGAVALASPVLAQSERYEGVEDLPQINLRMSDTNSPSSPFADPVHAFVDYVTDASEGKIQIEVFWSNALMKPMESAEGVGSGLADIGPAFAHFRPSDFPVSDWVQRSSLWIKGGQPFGTMVGTAASTEFFASSADVAREFESRNLHMLNGSGANAYDILCNVPFSDLESVRGLRTRTGTTTLAAEAEALGMVATPIDSADAYEAFSRGIINCGQQEALTYVLFGWLDTPGQKYWMPIQLSGLVLPGTAINLDTWNNMPQVARDIINDGMGAYAQAQISGRMALIRQFGDAIRDGRVQAVPVDPAMQAAVDAFDEQYLDAMVAEAPEGVENPQAVKDELVAVIEKWERIISEDLGIHPTTGDLEGVVDSWYTDYDFTAYGERLGEELSKAGLE